MNLNILKNSLITKVLLLVGFVEFIAFSLMGYISSENYVNNLEAQVNQRLLQFNKMISNEEIPISTISRESYMSHTIGEPYVEGLILGSTNIVIVSSNPIYLGRNIKDLPYYKNWFSQKTDVITIKEKNNLINITKIKDKSLKHTIYTSIIVIDNQKFESIKNSILLNSILASLFFILISTSIIVFLAQKYLANRINDSLEIISKAQKGDLKVQIDILSHDEIGRLQSEINLLIKKVDKFLNDYKKSVKSLEDQQKITLEQKNKLLDSEFRWKFAVEGSGDGLWDWNLVTNEVFFSKQWKNMLGFKDNEISGSLEEWDKRVNPEQKKQVYDDIQNHLDGKTTSYVNIHQVLCKDNNYKWILDRGIIVQRDTQGNPTRMIGIHTDISNQKRLEEEIQKEKDFVSTMIDSANAIVAVINNKGEMIRVNRYTENFVGYTKEEIASEPYFWSRFLFEEIRDKVKGIVEKAKNGEIVKSYKNSWISKSGEVKMFEWSNTLVLKDDNTMDYIATIGIDITEKEKIQDQILNQKQEFESIFKYSKDGIVIVDTNANYLNFNEAYTQMLETTAEKLKNQKCEIFNNNNLMNDLLEKNSIDNFEIDIRIENNQIIHCNLSLSLFPDKKRALLIIKDVSAIKLFEKQSRLASMGEMIGNIAHQWRQPLSVISSSASALRLYHELGQTIEQEQIIDTSDKIVEQTLYLSKTIDDFRDFVKGEVSFRTISVTNFLNEMLNLVKPALKNNYINLILDIEADLKINANKNELIQALINIVNNAKDIIKEKVENEQDRLLLISTKSLENDKLELKITDSAGGIDPLIIDKIFDPYFTTKHQAIGTGLGLSMADKIIRERHRFVMEVSNVDFKYNSKDYKGACFKIIFDKEEF